MDFPSARSCLPAVRVTPDTFVSASEKWPTSGTLTDSSSKGKYSLEGIPPPSDIRPGVARYLAASFNELPLRMTASWVRISDTGQFCIRSAVEYEEEILTIPSLGLGLFLV